VALRVRRPVAAPAPRSVTGHRIIALLAPATFFEGYDGLLLGLALPLIGTAAVGLFAFQISGTPARVFGLGLVIFFLTGSTPCVAAYTTEPFPPESRGRVGAILRVVNIAGAGAAPALTGLLAADRFLGSVGRALSAVGLSYGLAAVVVLTLLPETRGLDLEPDSQEGQSADPAGSP